MGSIRSCKFINWFYLVSAFSLVDWILSNTCFSFLFITQDATYMIRHTLGLTSELSLDCLFPLINFVLYQLPRISELVFVTVRFRKFNWILQPSSSSPASSWSSSIGLQTKNFLPVCARAYAYLTNLFS